MTLRQTLPIQLQNIRLCLIMIWGRFRRIEKWQIFPGLKVLIK